MIAMAPSTSPKLIADGEVQLPGCTATRVSRPEPADCLCRQRQGGGARPAKLLE
jgi:hypothetical protein